MATAELTTSVLAGGRVFPAGTARNGEAAEVIPAGDWWSDYEAGQTDGDGDQQDAPFDPAGHNIEQVLDHLGLTDGHDPVTVEEFARVRAAEADGKARTTLLEQLDAVGMATYGQTDGDGDQQD